MPEISLRFSGLTMRAGRLAVCFVSYKNTSALELSVFPRELRVNRRAANAMSQQGGRTRDIFA
jgi:hypothetical protein